MPEVTELRRQVRSARGSYCVIKNTLARRAIKGTKFEALQQYLEGTVAVAFSEADPVALAKVLTTFAKTAPSLTIKAALVQGQALPASEVAELASLPAKPQLYAKLLFVLQGPMVQLVSVLNAAPREPADGPDAGGEEEGGFVVSRGMRNRVKKRTREPLLVS